LQVLYKEEKTELLTFRDASKQFDVAFWQMILRGTRPIIAHKPKVERYKNDSSEGNRGTSSFQRKNGGQNATIMLSCVVGPHPFLPPHPGLLPKTPTQIGQGHIPDKECEEVGKLGTIVDVPII
jgi:hypothetical protein